MILGAGSSVDYGYPTAKKLTELIYDEENYSDLIKNVENSQTPLIEKYLSGLNYIRAHFKPSRNLSIDSWLAKDENQGSAEAGKLLIAYLIAQIEKKSFFTEIFELDWYQLLFNHLATDDFNDFGSSNKNLTIVTFNYDRSLEKYLVSALLHTYGGRPFEEYWCELSSIPIIHVYGKIGGLSANEANYIPYTHPPTHLDHYIDRSKNLKIIPEARDKKSNPEIITIHEKLKEAHYIFFIGFGYDRLNLEVLDFPFKSTNPSIQIIGSGYKMEKGEIKRAESNLIYTEGQDKTPTELDPECDAYTFFNRHVVDKL